MTRPVVLIVDDNADYREGLVSVLEELGFDTLDTDDAETAFNHVHRDRRIRYIVMDACLRTGEPDTLELTQRIRDLRLDVIMIASSSLASYNKLLIEAGCDYDCPKDRVHVWFQKRLLKQPQTT